jgi:tellurite methyltransferase
MNEGGYDLGYRACPCFWGTEPGTLVRKLATIVGDFRNLQILDVGCGEGKNAWFFANQGATVRAVDISALAIENGEKCFGTSPRICWEVADVRTLELRSRAYDIVVAYGLLHCLASATELRDTIARLKSATKSGGFNVVCCFNDRDQDLSAHPGFTPTLLSHSQLVSEYEDWDLISATDSDLVETHPNNGILHQHSLTRIIAQRKV